jgi:hypothetical protein
LYISTGDGSFQNPYQNGTSPSGRPSQNPNDLRGKLLRVDVAGGDAYPSDALRNYAIPTANPIPAYNAAHPTAPIAGLGEVYATGIRNASRVSFDRGTGDIYMGDVGEVAREEVNFLKVGTNPGGPPADFGWPQREATAGSGISGAPQAKVNPFTGVASLEPVQQYLHFGGGNAVIGGYVHRGPVASLNGKYVYADYVSGRVWQLDFNRDTDPGAFNGSNGIVTELTAQWNALVVDPNDPTYTPATGDLFGIDHLVSFGEDNAGNLYVVDFGHGFGFPGQYPGAGLGEIFRITPVPEPGIMAALPVAALSLLRRSRRAVR